MNSCDFFKVYICCKGWPLWLHPSEAPVILVAYTVASWINLRFLSLKIQYCGYYDYYDSCYYCDYFLITTVNQFSVLTPVFVVPYEIVIIDCRNLEIMDLKWLTVGYIPDFIKVRMAVLLSKCGWTGLINALDLFVLHTSCK